MPILTVRVAVVPGEDIGSTRRTGWGGAERVAETRCTTRQGIDVRRLDDGAAETPGQRTPVIGDQ